MDNVWATNAKHRGWWKKRVPQNKKNWGTRHHHGGKQLFLTGDISALTTEHICINYRTWLLYSSIIDKMYVESRENPMPPTWFVPPFSRLISLTRGVFTMQSYAFRLYPASFTFCFLTTVHPNSAYFQAYGVYFQAYGVSPIVKQCNFVLSPLLSLYIYARAYMRPLPHTTERQRQCALYCQKWTLFLPSISSKRCKICTR